jgi:hypothetical protein
MSMMLKKLLFFGGLIGVSTLAVFLFRDKQTQIEQVYTDVSRVGPAPVNSPPNTAQSIAIHPKGSWDEFRKKFGNELQARFLTDGRLASVRGSLETSQRAGAAFITDDSQKSIARAREVIDAASDLFRVQEGLPLMDPVVQGGGASVQVTFREMIDGVPVAPLGSVTVNLGRHGELLGLYSEYVPGVRVTNGVIIDREQAKNIAVAAITDKSSGLGAEVGTHIIWVSVYTGKSEGRHAYEFSIQGRQVIIDAATGAILQRRDKRIF